MPFDNKLNHPDEAILVALGSNLSGDYASPQSLLEAALANFPTHDLNVIRRSSWWRSAAWPEPTDPPFINGVAWIATDRSATETLEALHAVEAAFGRNRHVRNAPRTLDLDLIAYGREIRDHPRLPHPRAHERAFVMRPVAEIASGWRHPVLHVTAADLALTAAVGGDAFIFSPHPPSLAGD